MITSLNARLRQLESAGNGGAHLRGVVVVPAGMALADDAIGLLIEEHREQTAWRGTVVVLPDNGRTTAP